MDKYTAQELAYNNGYEAGKRDAVVHAYWYTHHGFSICSRCGSIFDTDLTMLQVPSTWKNPNYCPNCGAKMDLERKDTDE